FPLVLLSASSVPRELSLGNGRHALESSNASACLFHVCKQTSVVLHEVAATKRTRRMVAASILQVISFFVWSTRGFLRDQNAECLSLAAFDKGCDPGHRHRIAQHVRPGWRSDSARWRASRDAAL